MKREFWRKLAGHLPTKEVAADVRRLQLSVPFQGNLSLVTSTATKKDVFELVAYQAGAFWVEVAGAFGVELADIFEAAGWVTTGLSGFGRGTSL